MYRIWTGRGVQLPPTIRKYPNIECGPHVRHPHGRIVRSEEPEFNEELLAIVRAGIGIDKKYIDVIAAAQRTINVGNTPDGNSVSVAELTFGLIIGELRSVPAAIKKLRAEAFRTDIEDIGEHAETVKREFIGNEVCGKTIFVIGMGNVGKRIVLRALAFEMNVLAYDPYISEEDRLEHFPHDIGWVDDVRAGIQYADFVSMNARYTEETHHMIGAAEIACAKPSCIFLNLGRSGLYDDIAIRQAAMRRKIRKYFSDFAVRDLLLPDVANIIDVTPHLGGNTEEAIQRCAVMAYDQLVEFFLEGTVRNSVTFPRLKRPKRRGYLGRLAVTMENVPDTLARVLHVLGSLGVNVEPLTHDGEGKIGYALLDTPELLDAAVVDAILRLDGVKKARVMAL